MRTRITRPASSVEQFLVELDHPLKVDIEALRRIVLSAAAGISEEIKWGAPSFRTSEHFATMRLNGKDPLQLILHLGSRKQQLPAGAIQDPTGMLSWLGADRAMVRYSGPGAVQAGAHALGSILRQWVRYVRNND